MGRRKRQLQPISLSGDDATLAGPADAAGPVDATPSPPDAPSPVPCDTGSPTEAPASARATAEAAAEAAARVALVEAEHRARGRVSMNRGVDSHRAAAVDAEGAAALERHRRTFAALEATRRDAVIRDEVAARSHLLVRAARAAEEVTLALQTAGSSTTGSAAASAPFGSTPEMVKLLPTPSSGPVAAASKAPLLPVAAIGGSARGYGTGGTRARYASSGDLATGSNSGFGSSAALERRLSQRRPTVTYEASPLMASSAGAGFAGAGIELGASAFAGRLEPEFGAEQVAAAFEEDEYTPGIEVGPMVAEMMRQFVPAALATVLFFGNQTVTTMFVGRTLGPQLLAQYSVGCSMYNVTGMSVCFGLAAALETIAPQLHGAGAGARAMGALLVRGVLLCLAAAAPMAVFFVFSEPTMRLVFGPELAPGVQAFLVWSIPNLLLQVVANCLRRTLQGQRVADISMRAAVVSFLVCPAANFLLTPRGLPGAVGALTVCSLVELLAAYFYAARDKRVEYVTPRGGLLWDRAAVLERAKVRDFLAVGAPALLSLIAVWWAFELFVTFAARLGRTAVNTYAINTSLTLVTFSLPNGMSIAIAVLVGNALGGGRPHRARRFAVIGVLASLLLSLANVAGLFAFADAAVRLYTRNGAVEHMLSHTRLGLLVVVFLDGMQTAVRGLFKGAGQQFSALTIAAAALWLVGVPLGFVITFRWGFGIDGLYIGVAVGLAVMVLGFLLAAFRWDWEELAEAAVLRNQSLQGSMILAEEA